MQHLECVSSVVSGRKALYVCKGHLVQCALSDVSLLTFCLDAPPLDVSRHYLPHIIVCCAARPLCLLTRAFRVQGLVLASSPTGCAGGNGRFLPLGSESRFFFLDYARCSRFQESSSCKANSYLRLRNCLSSPCMLASTPVLYTKRPTPSLHSVESKTSRECYRPCLFLFTFCHFLKDIFICKQCMHVFLL